MEKLQSGLCGCLRLGLYTRCSTRLLPRDPKYCRARYSPGLGPIPWPSSTVQYAYVRSCLPQPSRGLLAGSDVPAFWHLAGHNGSLFYSHLERAGAVLHYWAHRPRDPIPARLPWGKNSSTVVE